MNYEEMTPEHRDAVIALDTAVKHLLEVIPEEEKTQVKNGTLWTLPVNVGREGKDEWVMVLLNAVEIPESVKAAAAS